MTTFLERMETTPTIPVTGVLLDRHPEIRSVLQGVDLAIHGYRHRPYATITREERTADLDAARAAFERQHLAVQGFRAPYLQAGDGTLDLLRKRAFLFDSSIPRFVLPATHPVYASSLRLARARYGSMPTERVGIQSDGRMVELPVSLPDDEVLVDGLGLRTNSGLWSVYEAMLNATAASGGLLVLQIHPERFHLCQVALGLLLARATDMGAWKAPLSEIAKWIVHGHADARDWPHRQPYAVSVSGDLDAVALGDFASRFLGA